MLHELHQLRAAKRQNSLEVSHLLTPCPRLLQCAPASFSTCACMPEYGAAGLMFGRHAGPKLCAWQQQTGTCLR